MDHDNDGITDDDTDGNGPGSYDEDDDNDARIDQFKWPCDFDGDGLQDYFDLDDDNDGVEDILDEHPWDSSLSGDIRTIAPLWVESGLWLAGPKTFNVEIDGTGYNPDTLNINPGDTVIWTNTDTSDHTVTHTNSQFNQNLLPGDTFSFTFTSSGSCI